MLTLSMQSSTAQEVEQPSQIAVPETEEMSRQVDELSQESDADPAQRRDPFSPEPIFNQNANDGTRQVRQRQFIPSAVPQRLPEMSLRGIGRSRHAEAPTVLLEIEGHGLYVVTEGDTITLQASRPDSVIRIREISDISVVLEVGSFGEVIVLR
ncbi:MAG: hypothetical protein AAGD47_00450 [Pseudomonadota bacterium]